MKRLLPAFIIFLIGLIPIVFNPILPNNVLLSKVFWYGGIVLMLAGTALFLIEIFKITLSFMRNTKNLSKIWAISIPFVLLISFMSLLNAGEQLLSGIALFGAATLCFVAGAISGFLPETSKLRSVLLWLPLIPIAILILTPVVFVVITLIDAVL